MSIDMGIFISVVSFVILISNFYINDRKSKREETRRDTEIEVKLNNLIEKVDTLGKELAKLREESAKDKELIIELKEKINSQKGGNSNGTNS